MRVKGGHGSSRIFGTLKHFATLSDRSLPFSGATGLWKFFAGDFNEEN
jgi:hypothetical protein